jgi:hypothetical protein
MSLADLGLEFFFLRDHIVELKVDEHVFIGQVEELKILPLIHLVLVYVVIALMSDNPSYHLYCCHGLGVDHVQQTFFREFANNATLAAYNVLRPLSIFEEFFNTKDECKVKAAQMPLLGVFYLVELEAQMFGN